MNDDKKDEVMKRVQVLDKFFRDDMNKKIEVLEKKLAKIGEYHHRFVLGYMKERDDDLKEFERLEKKIDILGRCFEESDDDESEDDDDSADEESEAEKNLWTNRRANYYFIEHVSLMKNATPKILKHIISRVEDEDHLTITLLKSRLEQIEKEASKESEDEVEGTMKGLAITF